MSDLDDTLGPIGLELIDEFGKTVTFIQHETGAYDPVTGTALETLDVQVQIKALVEDTAGTIFANLVQGATKKLTISALKVADVPKLLSRFTIDNIVYVTKETKVIYSGEQACLYQIWVGQ
jgi:hypothetical protein